MGHVLLLLRMQTQYVKILEQNLFSIYLIAVMYFYYFVFNYHLIVSLYLHLYPPLLLATEKSFAISLNYCLLFIHCFAILFLNSIFIIPLFFELIHSFQSFVRSLSTYHLKANSLKIFELGT
jgi:hypothetical protein